MRKQWLAMVLACSAFLFLLVACGGATSSTSSSTSSGSVVHMNGTEFVQLSITIHKGESITLVADTAIPHIIANGTWDHSIPKKAKELGAPSVNGVQVNEDSQMVIGPFNTAGTFHLYCTIHTNMNLAIIVQ